jgi:hypothetical protein
MIHPRACLSCGELMHGIDAHGHYCGKPRCADTAETLSPAGSRVTVATVNDDEYERLYAMSDHIAMEQERERRREHRELYS